ncbi:Yip1 member 6 [Cichlidogyrus casuarinus]|uniref:Yip1 member 6 n=1 Tax=Cichlidogyrus casuarinus TaxID=1844966 RepID=A0ABD2QKA5_9PLAT
MEFQSHGPLMNDQLLEGDMSSNVKVSDQEILSTLDEPIKTTIQRDLASIWIKFQYVLFPRSGNALLKEWDLWGPLVLCLVLSVLLQTSVDQTASGSGPEFAQVFVAFWIGAIIVTMNSQLLGGSLSFFQTVCVLGYCVFPLVTSLVICRIILIAQQTTWLFVLRLFIVLAGLIYSSVASVMFLMPSQKPRRTALATGNYEGKYFEDKNSFKKVHSCGKDEYISHLAAGWNFSFALINSRSVLALGCNKFGQLGHEDLTKTSNCLHFDENVIEISAGLRFAAALDQSGRVHLWGENYKSRLFTDALHLIQRPRIVDRFKSKIIKISCGRLSLTVLQDNGDVIHEDYASNKVTTFRRGDQLPIDDQVTAITSGWGHVLILLSSGRVFSFGRNTLGQLGRPESEQQIGQVIFPGAVKQMSAGAEHNLVLLEDGRVMSWGWNEHGMCGLPQDQQIIHRPTFVPNLPHPIKFVSTGYGHSLAIYQ